MPFVFMSHSLRQILPRKEIREQDRRSGAYPVKSKTGDRTRTGRNSLYFDDTRAVMFMTGVNITYPTTLAPDPARVAYDLTCSIGDVIGSVDPFAVDQFIPHRQQSETAGPFVEASLYEQDEHAVVDSAFMTGAAYGIASERFKSGLSSKTIVRMEYPLLEKSTLSDISSSMAYFNPTAGRFETIVRERSYNLNGSGFPATFAPILFTPYGFHYMPLNDYVADNFGGGVASLGTLPAKIAYKRSVTYAADGSDGTFYPDSSGYTPGYATASVMNPAHVAHVSQSIVMKNKLSSPFLIEKIVVEFPFEAGPGWLNDCFGITHIMADDLAYAIDSGGPMITVGLLRQDKSGARNRDLIASGTITSANDAQLGNYKLSSTTYGGAGSYTDQTYTHEGVVGMRVVPSVVITGSDSPAGPANFFTGTVKLVMDPQITSHVCRFRASGSSFFYWGGADDSATDAYGLSYGAIARRSSKFLESGRSSLGNQFALIDQDALDGALNPILGVDTQYEQLPQDFVAPRFSNTKIFMDVVSKTTKSPYLLYPEDDLVLCLSKHRAAGSNDAGDWVYAQAIPTALSASHDVGIGMGSVKITLYGDLIKEDREYHDTLNQRLETVELGENVGDEPILDQFDVAYRDELSGSYVDRFNVTNATKGLELGLSSSLFMTQYYSNYSQAGDASSWSSQYSWSNARRVSDLKKSSKNVTHLCSNEKFWDCRVPDPFECIMLCNSSVKLGGYDISNTTISFMLYTGNTLFADAGSATDTGQGIKDWMMTYPYEQRYKSVTQKFSDALIGALFSRKDPGVAGTFKSFTPYQALSIEVGHSSSTGVLRQMGSEVDTNFGLGHNGLTKPEFLKAFYGIGNGRSNVDNQHVTFRVGSNTLSQSVVLRGWRYGMMSALPLYSNAVYRRDRFGQPRDMLEQRLDAVFFDEIGLSANGNLGGVVGTKDGPVQVKFYDREGNITDPLRTLTSNMSTYATSSVPYTDGIARNRSELDYDNLNISVVTV